MKVICDIETNAIRNPDRLWCIVVKDIETEQEYVFREPDVNPKEHQRFVELSKRVTTWVGHNFLCYDAPIIRQLMGVSIPWYNIVDTLVVSRLIYFENPKLKGKHSLEAWGEYFKYPKINFNDFESYSEDMVEYCLMDVRLNLKLYRYLSPYLENPQWKDSLEIEHYTALVCRDINLNGFAFDKNKAQHLLTNIETDLYTLRESIRNTIRVTPKVAKVTTINPKKNLTKNLKGYLKECNGILDLNDSRTLAVLPVRVLNNFVDLESGARVEGINARDTLKVGEEIEIFEEPEFNPNSSKQRVEVLWEAGWKPTAKTKGHKEYLKSKRWGKKPKGSKELDEYWSFYGWSCNDENLLTLPESAPEGARVLAQYLTLEGRRRSLVEWLEKLSEDNRIHGGLMHIGAWTHRKSHARPNTANISKKFKGEITSPIHVIKQKYDSDLRSCWMASPDTVLVGTDADSIQLRILAHYVNNEDYIYAVEKGNKDDKTDIHNVNLRALGLGHLNRDHAKTFIYAWVLGASIPKLSEILECSQGDAKRAEESFIRSVSGLSELKSGRVRRDAERGYFVGLDNRKVVCRSNHLMLAGYLQNGESVIMKRANRLWRHRLKQEGIWFRQVNDVHDEWQTEFKPEDAERGAEIQRWSLEQTGRDLGLKVKLAGESKIGKNWAETH